MQIKTVARNIYTRGQISYGKICSIRITFHKVQSTIFFTKSNPINYFEQYLLILQKNTNTDLTYNKVDFVCTYS